MLECIRHLEFVKLGEGNLWTSAGGTASAVREAFWHMHSAERIDVGRHASPRSAITIAGTLGVTSRSPNTAPVRTARRVTATLIDGAGRRHDCNCALRHPLALLEWAFTICR